MALSRASPLGVGQVARAGGAVPGAVGVSGQAALGARLPVHTAAVEGHLGDARVRAHVQLLLLDKQRPAVMRQHGKGTLVRSEVFMGL